MDGWNQINSEVGTELKRLKLRTDRSGIWLWRTFHDLFATDAELPWAVAAQGGAGVGVDDLELGVPDDGAAGSGLDLERLLGERQAHGQHGPGLRHPIAL